MAAPFHLLLSSVYCLCTQDEKVKNSLKDNELLNLFTKLQSLSNKQQDTVKDLISDFILKADLQKNLTAVK